MSKIIGIIPLYDDARDSYWLVPGYMKMLEAQGAVPVMLPLTDNESELECLFEMCGGFLLTGGQDVSPDVYGAQREPYCGEDCKMRDTMETYILKHAVDRDKSVLGICRGIQFMNACFGGTLYQDLDIEYKSGVNHHMSPPYDRAVHKVVIDRNSFLYKILGIESMGVNSYHHQAIRELAPGFTEMARSEDGIIEAVAMPSKRFIVGVQWHPEFSYQSDDNSRKLAEAFVNSIK